MSLCLDFGPQAVAQALRGGGLRREPFAPSQDFGGRIEHRVGAQGFGQRAVALRRCRRPYAWSRRWTRRLAAAAGNRSTDARPPRGGFRAGSPRYRQSAGSLPTGTRTRACSGAAAMACAAVTAQAWAAATSPATS